MPVTYQYLTDRTLVNQSGITTDTLIHVVVPNDLTQNVAGSSYKAKLSQLISIFSGSTFTGGTVSGATNFTNGLTASTVSATTYQNLPVSGITAGNNINVSGSSGNFIISFTGVTGGSTFTGGTVSGATNFTSGLTANTISATTYENLPVSGITAGNNINVSGSSGNYIISVTGITGGSTFTGGTVSGATNFTNGITANTISATTYQNLPVSGLTEGNNINISGSSGNFTISFTGVTGGSTFTGGTVSGATNFTNGITANTISATTYQNLPVSGLTAGNNINVSGSSGNFTISVTGLTQGLTGEYLPLSGGTVTGGTVFTSGLTANTLNVSGLTQTSGITSTGGVTFKQVTINSTYSATTQDYMIDVTGGTFNVYLPSAVGIQGRLLVVKNNGGGAVTVLPTSGQNIDDKPYVILGETNTIQLASNGSNWIAISYNISTVNSSTGVFVFTGLTIASPTTFTVAPVKGWIVNDTTNPLSPQLYYVEYSGGTHTATYVNTATETWVYLTSGGTISQSNINLTDQQRRQNIFLGKLGHANKTTIINAFSQPDFVLSPLSQLRDMFDPIGFVNAGIRPSANGVNLSFNTSAGYLHGLGINFANSTLNPNAIYVSGTSPCTFQYRTQTGGTASNTTLIDPTVYDVGGVVTSISGAGGRSTNQRIYLVQNGVFRIQYGQTFYSSLAAAVAGIATEPYVEFTNFENNGILIGVLSVRKDATDLSDTTKALFFNVSKFGDSSGAAGGSATTTLQQAYNNSVNPEIVTNSTLGPLSVKNGEGTADNVTNVFEGVNSGGTTTSYVRADGAIYGSTISGVTISATTYQNLPVSGLTEGNNINISGSSGNFTISVTGITGGSTFTGGTVSGATNFTSGLTANTISATTYQNLPVSGLTEGSNINVSNSSGNFTISVTGITGGSTFTGGTVSGATNFTNGLTANTISGGTYIGDGSQLNVANPSTGTTITFTAGTIYNTPTSAATGDISADTTNAKIGIVQKIYHNDSVAPTFNPSGWVKLGIGTYTISTLNVIYAEWVSGTRVEYWIVNGS